MDNLVGVSGRDLPNSVRYEDHSSFDPLLFDPVLVALHQSSSTKSGFELKDNFTQVKSKKGNIRNRKLDNFVIPTANSFEYLDSTPSIELVDGVVDRDKYTHSFSDCLLDNLLTETVCNDISVDNDGGSQGDSLKNCYFVSEFLFDQDPDHQINLINVKKDIQLEVDLVSSLGNDLWSSLSTVNLHLN